MSSLRMVLGTAAIAAAAFTVAHARERARDSTVGAEPQRDARTGPDSARVASLLAVLGSGDALVCEMIADQMGNGWWGSDVNAPGRFSDARADMAAAKDSLHGRITHAGTQQLLIATLSHENACVRRAAAKLLGRSRIETARLIALLDDTSPRVREAAAFAIGAGEKRSARVPLETMLARGGAAEAAMAAWALAEEQDEASAPALERAMRHDDARVRRASAYARGEIGLLRSVDVLSRALTDREPSVQYAAAHAIGELHDLETPPTALLDACRSSDRTLARIATLIVADKHDPATLDLLLSLLNTDDREVRLHVTEALGEIGSVKASDALVRLLKDADPEIRRAAAEALGEIRENAERP